MAPSALKDVNLSVDGTTVAEVKSDGDHYKNAGQKFLLYYGEKIYSTSWKTMLNSDGSEVEFTEDNITMLSGQTISDQQ